MLKGEKLGLKDLLKTLPSDVLYEVTDTVTKKQIQVKSEDEAIDALIAYSTSSAELIGRKKIKREYLFTYLHSKGIVVPPQVSKAEAIVYIQKYWDSEFERVQHKTAEQNQQSPANLSLQQYAPPPAPPCHESGVPHSSPSGHTTINVVQNYTVYNQLVLSPESGRSKSENTVSRVVEKQEAHLQQLGETFAKWYFEQLNAENPTTASSKSDFGPHHFWEDASLMSLCLVPERVEDHCEGASLVAQKLLGFVKDEKLLFNPNVSTEGIKVKSESHGLVIVLVCGTVHRGNSCLGMFDQMFGLIKDPALHNNWKIKVTKLKIQSSTVLCMPKLTDKSADEIKDLEAV